MTLRTLPTDSVTNHPNHLRHGQRLWTAPPLLKRLLVLSLLLSGSTALAQRTWEWPPEVAPLVHLWWLEDFDQVKPGTTYLMRTSENPNVRQAADVAYALCLLRSPVRDDITEGRATIARVAETNPGVLEDVAVVQALAWGHITLAETTSALTKLIELEKRLANDEDQMRLAAVMRAEAEAWLVHNEWESTPVPGVVPETLEDMFTFRLKQLQALSKRAAELKLPLATRDALTWAEVRARLDAPSEAQQQEGQKQWRAFAKQAVLTPAVIAARWKLIDQLTVARAWSQVKPMLGELASAADEETVAKAQAQLYELSQPRLSLDAPDSVAPGSKIKINFEARNLDRVRLTLRRLDVHGWLEAQHGRFEANSLPVAGSLIQETVIQRPDSASVMGWSVKDDAPALEIEAGRGQYVLQAVGTHADGEIDVRQMIQVTGVRAHLTVGRQRAVLWLPEAAGDVTGRLEFWMRDAFVPLRLAITGSVQDFDLPGEARVFRDKRWVALLELGEEAVLFQGQLPLGNTDSQRQRVVLTGSPNNPRVGDVFQLSGRLLNREAETEAAPLTVHFEDASGTSLHTADVTPDASGTFTTQWTLPVAVADKPVRIRVTKGRVAIPPADEPFSFRTQPIMQAPLMVRYLGPDWLPEWAPHFQTWQLACYPWDTNADESLFMTASLDFLLLPDEDHGLWSRVMGPYEMHSHGQETLGSTANMLPLPLFPKDTPLGTAMMQHIDVDLPDLGITHQPIGLRFSTIAHGWDERPQKVISTVILNKTVWQAWLAPVEHAPIRANAPLRLRLNWFDTLGLTYPAAEHVRIKKDGQLVKTLSLFAELGAFATEAWIPSEAGHYTAEVSMSRGLDHDETVVTPFEVLPAETEMEPRRLNVTALLDTWSTPATVTLQLDAASDRDLLVTMLGDTLGTAALLPAGQDHLTIELDPELALPSAVSLLTSEAGQLAEVGRATLRPQPASAPHLVLAAKPGPYSPGVELPVRVSVSDPGTVLVKLTSREDRSVTADRYGSVTPAAHENAAALSFTGVGEEPAELERTGEDPRLLGAWSKGGLVWHQLVTIEGETELKIPLPNRNGLFDVSAYLTTPSGTQAQMRQVVEIKAPLETIIDIPDRILSGDRLAVAIWLRNLSDKTQTGTLNVAAEAGVALEGELSQGFELAPGQEKIVRLLAEGTTPGWAKLTATLTTGDQTWRQPHVFEVVEPQASSDPRLALVSVQRSVRLLDREVLPDGTARGDWIELLIPENTPIPLGSRILIRDEITPRQPLVGLTWEQQFGGNLSTVNQDVRELRGPASSAERAADRMSAPLTRLVQPQIFETIAVATRPGVSSLPPPRFESRGQRIPIHQSPEAVFIRVTE